MNQGYMQQHWCQILPIVFFMSFSACIQKTYKTYNNVPPEQAPEAPESTQQQSFKDSPESEENAGTEAEVSINLPGDKSQEPLKAADAPKDTKEPITPSPELYSGGSGGNLVGNGGTVFICTDPKSGKTSYELLDYYEARSIYQLQIKNNTEVEDAYTLVSEKLNLLKKKDPVLADELQEIFESYIQNVVMLSDYDLVTINDNLATGVPQNCKLKQLAIQRTEPGSDTIQYLIDNQTFKAMPTLQQAGLILHEIIYRYFIDTLFVSNSLQARYFNATISSDNFDTDLSLKAYVKKLSKIGLNYRWQSMSFYSNSLEFIDDNTIGSGQLIVKPAPILTDVATFTPKPLSTVYFWSNGLAKTIEVNDIAFGPDQPFYGQDFKKMTIDFYPVGYFNIAQIAKTDIFDDIPIFLMDFFQIIYGSSGWTASRIQFYPDDAEKSVIKKTARLKISDYASDLRFQNSTAHYLDQRDQLVFNLEGGGFASSIDSRGLQERFYTDDRGNYHSIKTCEFDSNLEARLNDYVSKKLSIRQIGDFTYAIEYKADDYNLSDYLEISFMTVNSSGWKNVYNTRLDSLTNIKEITVPNTEKVIYVGLKLILYIVHDTFVYFEPTPEDGGKIPEHPFGVFTLKNELTQSIKMPIRNFQNIQACE